MRGANGTLTQSLVDRCIGYTIESRLEADFGFSNGLTNVVRHNFAGWESRDGTDASFRMQIFENGMLEEAYRGRVADDADGIAAAIYEGATSARYPLPPETLSATGFIAALVKSAKAGEQFFAHTVMDGTFPDGPYRVTGVIAPWRGADEPRESKSNQNGSGPGYWPISMAYFPLESGSDTPALEVSLHLHANGTVGRKVHDFGGYAIAFEPVSLLPIEGAGC